MKLKQIKLTNFRGYRNETIINVEKGITAFIGKNDIGKSTVLEALEIFFNNKLVKIEPADLNNNAEDSETVQIACVFNDLPDEIVIDTDNRTSLQEEYLLNANGDLEIVKEYKCSNKSPGETVYIKANFPSHPDYKDVLDKRIVDLKKLARDLPVEDYTKKAELRKAIRENIPDLNPTLQLIPVKKEDGKLIWDKLSSQLPLFALFKSDRASNDQDMEVQDPMRVAVEMALKEVQDKIEIIKEKVESQALAVANRTLVKLSEMDSDLAKELIPQFKDEPKWNNIFKLTLNSDRGIPINKRGSGVRRLILLNFFRAEAERLREETNISNIIFAVEEPETSQHPSNQEKIINSLMEIAESGNSQVLLTTHVPGLAALLPLNSLRFIHKSETSPYSVIDPPSDESYRKIADSLGILPSEDTAKAKAIVMVEGPSDVIFFRHTAAVLKGAGYLKHDFEDKGIIPLIMGGCGNLKHWVNLKLLVALEKPFCVFMDSDKLKNEDIPGGEKNQKNIQEFKSQDIQILFTRKREIENYLSPSLLGLSSIDDFEDVKARVNDKRIFEKKWPMMKAKDILENDKYINSSGDECHELPEIINQIYSML